MKKVYLLLFIFSITTSYGQSNFQAEVDLGYAFQDKITLDNQTLKNSNSFGLRFGINYQGFLSKRVYIEPGVFGKFNSGKRSINALNFTANNLKLQIPVYFGFLINEKWRVSAGLSIENNKDFNKLNFKKKDNLRFDIVNKFIYAYTEKVHFSLYTNFALTNIQTTYSISSPKNGIYLGVIYAFIKKNKKETTNNNGT